MELEFVGGTVEIKSYQGRIIGGTEEECLALNKTLLECGRVVRIGPITISMRCFNVYVINSNINQQ